ncbi:MAG TPA: hypothetical protein VLW47_08375 [Thermodesulfobacteriota bacterium]|nr:hypothetical protein [Thermodesulfobacteriota bacterium]
MFVNPEPRRVRGAVLHEIVYPEPRGPRLRAESFACMGAFGEDMRFGVQARVLPMGQLVFWHGMFAPWRRLLATTGVARGAPFDMVGSLLYLIRYHEK